MRSDFSFEHRVVTRLAFFSGTFYSLEINAK